MYVNKEESVKVVTQNVSINKEEIYKIKQRDIPSFLAKKVLY